MTHYSFTELRHPWSFAFVRGRTRRPDCLTRPHQFLKRPGKSNRCGAVTRAKQSRLETASGAHSVDSNQLEIFYQESFAACDNFPPVGTDDSEVLGGTWPAKCGVVSPCHAIMDALIQRWGLVL